MSANSRLTIAVHALAWMGLHEQAVRAQLARTTVADVLSDSLAVR